MSLKQPNFVAVEGQEKCNFPVMPPPEKVGGFFMLKKRESKIRTWTFG
jgi:hypothetical protein